MGLDQDQYRRVPPIPVLLRRWSLPLVIAIAGLVAEYGGSSARVLLRYDRTAIAGGEWWRLVTGHVVHLGWPHYTMNVMALILIWLLVGRQLHFYYWCLVVVATLAGIDAGFLLFEQQLQWYVGLSGLLHGILAAGIVATLGKRQPELCVLGVLLVAKLVYEQLVGPLPGSESSAGGAVIVNAHLYGTLTGALAALPARIRPAAFVPI